MDPRSILLKPGDSVDRYQLVREISAGGSGRVFEAKHAFLDRVVALKLMHMHHADRPGARERMQAEALVLSRIKHSNVVRVHDAGLEGPLFWLAMDLLRGQDLRHKLYYGKRILVAEALNYAAEIADGVEAAHEIGVVHRDLKPENVFITEANEVKVLDLGTAKFSGYGLKTTDKFRVPGTLPYMSPEHCEGKAVDARSDVYALGIMLYEMIAGRHPFIIPGDEPGPHELVSRHLVAEPTPLTDLMPGLPAYVWRVVERALRKQREERYRSMREFATELRDTRHRALNASRKYSEVHTGSVSKRDVGGSSLAASPRPRSITPRMCDVASPTSESVGQGTSAGQGAQAFGPRGTFKMRDASAIAPPASMEATSPERRPTAVPAPAVPSAPPAAQRRTLHPVLVGACTGAIVMGTLFGIRKVVLSGAAAAPVAAPATSEATATPKPPSPAQAAADEASQAEIDAVVEQLAGSVAPPAAMAPAASAAPTAVATARPVAKPVVKAGPKRPAAGSAKWDEEWEVWLPAEAAPKAGTGP